MQSNSLRNRCRGRENGNEANRSHFSGCFGRKRSQLRRRLRPNEANSGAGMAAHPGVGAGVSTSRLANGASMSEWGPPTRSPTGSDQGNDRHDPELNLSTTAVRSPRRLGDRLDDADPGRRRRRRRGGCRTRRRGLGEAGGGPGSEGDRFVRQDARRRTGRLGRIGGLRDARPGRDGGTTAEGPERASRAEVVPGQVPGEARRRETRSRQGGRFLRDLPEPGRPRGPGGAEAVGTAGRRPGAGGVDGEAARSRSFEAKRRHPPADRGRWRL